MGLQGQLQQKEEVEYHDKAIAQLIPSLSSGAEPAENPALLATTVILRMSEQFSELAEDA